MGTVYYFRDHPYNNISSGPLKFYIGFQKVVYRSIENCDFVDPQGRYWISPYHTKTNLDYIKNKKIQGQPSQRQEYFCPNYL